MLLKNIFSLLYLIIILSFLVAGLFIIYHIVKYSINKTHSLIMLSIFIIVFGLLLILNLNLFFHLDFRSFSVFSQF